PRASPLRRAVVTLGTMRSYQFPRLLAKLSQIIPPEVDVLWQTGSTPVADLPIVANPWVPADELASAMTSADVIVGHCGSGTAIGALKSGSYAVLVPRHSGRGENVDDHQIALAQDLSARGLACTPSVEELTLAHLEQAATRRVERNAEPPPFELD
ncbi:MAG: glycosyltransferase, partial [Gaiellales bacterium]